MLITALVTAVPDSVITGPYKVSFDLGLNHSDYNITVDPPKHTEALNGIERTDYEIGISSNINTSVLERYGINRTTAIRNGIPSTMANLMSLGLFHYAIIGIKEFKEAQPVGTAEDAAAALKSIYGDSPNISEFNVATRTIDGTSGAVASMGYVIDSFPLEAYDALCTSAFDPSHVIVEITSFYPWDDGTLQLLKSIHVTRWKA